MATQEQILFTQVAVEYDKSININKYGDQPCHYKVTGDLQVLSKEIEIQWNKIKIIQRIGCDVVVLSGLMGIETTKAMLNAFPNSVTEQMKQRLPQIKGFKVDADIDTENTPGPQTITRSPTPVHTSTLKRKFSDINNNRPAPGQECNFPVSNSPTAARTRVNVAKTDHSRDIMIARIELALKNVTEANSERVTLEAKFRERILELENELEQEKLARRMAEKLLVESKNSPPDVEQLQEALTVENRRKEEQRVLIEQALKLFNQ